MSATDTVKTNGTMKAVGYSKSLPINEPESLIDIEIPQPIATGMICL